MKFFFALGLVVFGFTWSVVLGVNTVEENASGVGGWGGTCRCPDGTTYEVGDNKDGCGTLACVNGAKVNCYKYDGEWSNRKVTCGCEDLGDKMWIDCGDFIPKSGCMMADGSVDELAAYYCWKSCGFC